MTRHLATLPLLLLLGGCLVETVDPSSDELGAREALGDKLAGAELLWVRGDKIFHSPISPFVPELVTEGNVVEQYPRWSPDGEQIAFSRGLDIWLMDADFTNQRLIIPLAQWPAWADGGRAVTAVDAGRHRVVKHDLASGETTTIYDASEPGYHGEQLWRFAELHPDGRYLVTFRLDPEHTAEIVDLEQRRTFSNDAFRQGDCQPAWAPDGTYIVTTANTEQRPIRRTPFDARTGDLGDSAYLVGLDTPYVYMHHGQRISHDGRWLVFHSEFFEGPGMVGSSEIYLWEIGGTDDDVVRLTFNTAADEYPSLFVPSR